MHIQMKRHYLNMKGQQLIEGKVYDATSPLLGGLAAYLIEQNYAIAVLDPNPPIIDSEPLAVVEIGVDLAADETDTTVETVMEVNEDTGELDVVEIEALDAIEETPKAKRKK